MKMFSLELIRLAKFGIVNYDSLNQTHYFLSTIIKFSYEVLEQLEIYFKGKSITFSRQSNRQSSLRQTNQSIDYEAMEIEEEAKRQTISTTKSTVNFVSLLASFASYQTVKNMIEMLKFPSQLDRELIEAISCIFDKFIKQLNLSWIFFQLDTLKTFHEFLKLNRCEKVFYACKNYQHNSQSFFFST